MFGEILECLLEFIGSHSEEYGCDGKELLSFLSLDVLPHYGLGDHGTAQQIVLNLLIKESKEIIIKRGGKPVEPREVQNGTVPYDKCTFHPSLALQEKSLGVSLRFKNVRAAVNYACDNLVSGFRRFQNTGRDTKQNVRPPSVPGFGIGVRRLLREQWLRLLYVCGADEIPLVPYVWPHFAIPSAPGQTKQCLRPMETYLERRRKELQPHRIAIDPMVARRIILSSPERRLVLEDAVHAVFAAHGHEVPTIDGRRMRFGIRGMFLAAGLRIIMAYVAIKQTLRRVRVVVLDNDVGESRDDYDDDAAGDDEDASDDDEYDEDGDDDEEDGDNNNNNNNNTNDSSTEGEYDDPVTGKKNVAPFCIDPSYPLGLQVAKEAELRPLVVESVLPRVVIYDFRATENELHRFTRRFEERWGTIESTHVLSNRSKAFTRLLRPKGWDDHGGHSNNNVGSDNINNRNDSDGVEGKLPKGVSSWSVNKLMEALRSSPLKALTLNELTRMIDRRTLGRLIPYLRGEGLITTTGISSTKCRRIGVVALAGVELSADDRATMVQSYLDDLSAREQRRQQSTLLLQHLPEPAEGVAGHSAAATAISKPCPRSVRLVAKITMVRNGYSRISLFRVSRLHVELWRVWLALDQAPDTAMTLDRVLQEMSLSSFCIIVGIADVDVAEYIGDGTVPSCTWGTPIRRLPPTLQEHCRRSGVQPFLHSLAGLQSKNLVTSDESLAAYLDVSLESVSIKLTDTVLDERQRVHTFYRAGDMTPQDTCYAVMKFWSASWASAALAHEPYRAVELIRDVTTTESNLSNVQLVALSRLLRMDSSILAEHILQRQGVIRTRKRTIRDAMQADEYNRCGRGVNRLSHPRRRIEVSGVTMADALEAILHSDEPYRGLSKLQVLMRRHSETLHLSRYSPYGTRVHGSMYTLVQTIMNLIHKQGSGMMMMPALGKAMLSVVSPNFTTTTTSDTLERRAGETKDFTTTSAPPRSQSVDGHCNVNFQDDVPPREVLQDIMRMILLSDEAHYDAVAAKSLLAQFSEEDQQHCIDWLLSFPSFRTRMGGSGRLPRIGLSPVLSFLPIRLAATVTHPRSASASFMQDAATSLLFTSESNSRRWCMPPVPVVGEDATESDLLKRAPRLVEQPTMNMDSLAEEIREQKGFDVLRLPRFAWPARWAASLRSPSLGESGTNLAAAPEQMHPATSMQSRTEPYPARGLLRPWQRLRHLGLRDIPVDAAPSIEQVAMARSAVLTPEGTSHSPRFPSIFHHVDGSFHEFVWRSFLFAVFSLVHHSPGITEDQLMQRLKLSGLVSTASCRMAVEFLKASLVIVARRIMVSSDGEANKGPFSASSAACRYSECYFCTVSQEGPWNIIEL